MITSETLDLARTRQQKEHIAMFDEKGHFNPNNWNGGDSVIRQYFSPYYEDSCYMGQFAKDIDFNINDGEFTGSIVSSHTIKDDTSFATIVLDGWLEVDDEGKNIHCVTSLKWYKNRGKTDIFTHNGNRKILYDQDVYLFVLNAIEATGFKFDFWG